MKTINQKDLQAINGGCGWEFFLNRFLNRPVIDIPFPTPTPPTFPQELMQVQKEILHTVSSNFM